MKKLTKDKTFSDRLRCLIKKKLEIKQNEFCKKIGITQGYLSMVLSGKRGPSADLIAGIFLNYSEHLEWLLTGENSTKPDNEKITKVVIEHQDLVKRFKDPDQAFIINEQLVEIEETDQNLFKSVVYSIKAAWDAARAIKDATSKKTPDADQDHIQGRKSS